MVKGLHVIDRTTQAQLPSFTFTALYSRRLWYSTSQKSCTTGGGGGKYLAKKKKNNPREINIWLSGNTDTAR